MLLHTYSLPAHQFKCFIYLNDDEYGRVIQSLIRLKNSLIAQGRYTDAVDDILCREGDNQTIGLLLCQNKDRIMAEYALRDVHKPIGISDYELGKSIPHDIKSGLPSIEELESKLYQGLQDNESAE